MNIQKTNYARLNAAMQPESDYSPAEIELHRRYINFMFEYCAPLIRTSKNKNLKVIFPKPKQVYKAFLKTNGCKTYNELVNEIEGGVVSE